MWNETEKNTETTLKHFGFVSGSLALLIVTLKNMQMLKTVSRVTAIRELNDGGI